MTTGQAALKRTFDLIACSFALLFFAPVIIICALIARWNTGASGIFAQRRIGKHGKPFDVYKIRTMDPRIDARDTTITERDDPRITKLGALFRRFKLDELPQLWNVVRGDMSLVGPRPDVPGYADQLNGDDRRVLSIRPGITGPATIKYRDEELLLAAAHDSYAYNNDVVYPDKILLNLEYLDNWSLKKDLWYITITLGICKPPECLNLDANRSGPI